MKSEEKKKDENRILCDNKKKFKWTGEIEVPVLIGLRNHFNAFDQKAKWGKKNIIVKKNIEFAGLVWKIKIRSTATSLFLTIVPNLSNFPPCITGICYSKTKICSNTDETNLKSWSFPISYSHNSEYEFLSRNSISKLDSYYIGECGVKMFKFHIDLYVYYDYNLHVPISGVLGAVIHQLDNRLLKFKIVESKKIILVKNQLKILKKEKKILIFKKKTLELKVNQQFKNMIRKLENEYLNIKEKINIIIESNEIYNNYIVKQNITNNQKIHFEFNQQIRSIVYVLKNMVEFELKPRLNFELINKLSFVNLKIKKILNKLNILSTTPMNSICLCLDLKKKDNQLKNKKYYENKNQQFFKISETQNVSLKFSSSASKINFKNLKELKKNNNNSEKNIIKETIKIKCSKSEKKINIVKIYKSKYLIIIIKNEFYNLFISINFMEYF